jgi:hypothetical protein
MTSMPVQGTIKAELFEELQKESKSEIVGRLLKAKVSTNELAADTSPDEAHNYQQVIL